MGARSSAFAEGDFDALRKPAKRDERQQVLATARTYRRQGYRVTIPERGDPLPPFLAGLKPDLVAERDDDRVVVEVRRADAVVGSNDLVAFAERIAPQKGWRFELIAVAAPETITPPDLGSVEGEAERLAGLGFVRAAFLVAFAALENLLAFAAIREGITLTGTNAAFHARELAISGVISSDDYERVKQAVTLRDATVHGSDPALITRAALYDLLHVDRALEQELLVA